MSLQFWQLSAWSSLDASLNLLNSLNGSSKCPTEVIIENVYFSNGVIWAWSALCWPFYVQHQLIKHSWNKNFQTFTIFDYETPGGKLQVPRLCSKSTAGMANPWHECRTWHASSFLWHASQVTETSQRKSSNRSLTDQHIALQFFLCRTFEGVKTFFWLFTNIFRGNQDICGREDLFFALYRYFQGKTRTVGWHAEIFGRWF